MSGQDICIRRGDNAPPALWEFDFDPAGGNFTLHLQWRGGGMTLTTENGDLAIDGVNKRVSWSYSTIQSAQIPLGRLTRYRLQRRVPNGEQRVYAYGIVSGLMGISE